MNSQQMMRRNQNTSCSRSWQEMFPNPQLSEQTSTTFLKKLVAIAISNITYLRNLFPEGAFADRYLEGLNLKVLRDDGSFPAVTQLIRWIKGSFEALDNKYLRQLIIGIYSDSSNPNNVLETYSFHFSYTNKILSSCSYSQKIGNNKREMMTGRAVSPEDTFRQTLSLFRHCLMCTHSLKPLPKEAMINMRLLYYDEVTPEDYEPPGFKPSPVSSYTFVNNPILLNLGKTETPWHSMKLLIATDASDFEVAGDNSSMITEDGASTVDSQDDRGRILSQNSNRQHALETSSLKKSGDMSSQETMIRNSQDVNTSSQDTHNAVVPTISPDQPASAISAVGSSVMSNSEPELQQHQVRCPCETKQDDGLMINCEKCRLWQHACCFKILLEEEATQNHICELCHNDRRPCTDIFLADLRPSKRKEICLYRRALVYSSENYRICDQDLADSLGISITLAQDIIAKLDKDGVLKLTSKRSKGKYRLINKYNLKKTVLPQYFSENVATKSIPKVSETSEDNLNPENQFNKEISESIEEMTEKMSLNAGSEKNKTPCSSTLSTKKGLKRNFSAEIEDAGEVILSSQDCCPDKKKRKSSVSENLLL